jgi:hypothetical protein
MCLKVFFVDKTYLVLFFFNVDITVSVLIPRMQEVARTPEPFTDCLQISDFTPGLQAL